MDIQAIGLHPQQPFQGLQRPQGPPPPPPPPPEEEEGDAVELSSQAQALGGRLPSELDTALKDLQGGQANLLQDLHTLGRFFEGQPGGRKALDAFMAAHFTRDQLRAFQDALEAAGGPGRA